MDATDSHNNDKQLVHDSLQPVFERVEQIWLARGGAPLPASAVGQVAEKFLSDLEQVVNESSQVATEAIDAGVATAIRNGLRALRGETDLDPWMTPNEAARYLDMSRTTLNKMIDRQEVNFRARMVGKHRRIRRADVEAYWDNLMQRTFDPAKKELVRASEETDLYDRRNK